MSALVLGQQDAVFSVISAVLGLVGLVAIGFWVWMAIDCLTQEPPGTQRTLWLLCLLMGSWIGALIYYFMRRSERLEQATAGKTGPDFGVPPVAPRPSQPVHPVFDPGGSPFADSALVPPIPTGAKPPVKPGASGWISGVILAVLAAAVCVPLACGGIFAFTAWRHRTIRESMAMPDDYVPSPPSLDQPPLASPPEQVVPSGKPVTAATELQPGQPLLGEWAGAWYRVTVIQVKPDGTVRVHWDDWGDVFDEDMPRARLQLADQPAELGERQP